MDWSGDLLERENELLQLKQVFDLVRERSGQFVLIEGESGIGKTTLLESIRNIAQEGGFRCLVCRGSPLERSFAFGIVRQLFVPLFSRAFFPQRQRLSIQPVRVASSWR